MRSSNSLHTKEKEGSRSLVACFHGDDECLASKDERVESVLVGLYRTGVDIEGGVERFFIPLECSIFLTD
jgi:hypothetical protein